MKQLILLRHATSPWCDATSSDFDRPCVQDKLNELTLLRDLLIKKAFIPEHVLSSPAVRTVQTINYVCKGIYPDKKIAYHQSLYEGDSHVYFKLLQGLDDSFKNSILCGHNPSITELARQLLHQSINEMQPGESIWLEFNIDQWAELSETVATLQYRG